MSKKKNDTVADDSKQPIVIPKKRRKARRKENNHQVELSTPWGGQQSINASQGSSIRGVKQTIRSRSDKVVTGFIEERTRLHQIYLQEEAKTKRLWLSLSVILIIAALALIVFAPPGRETLSYWIGGALLVFAAGAAGYKRVWGKSKTFSMGADQDKRPE